MSRFFETLLPCFLLLLLSSCKGPELHVAGKAPAGVKQFASEFAALHRDTDDSFTSLLERFHWDGVEPETREAITRSLAYDLEVPIQWIQIEPWQPDFLQQYFGSEHHPNLAPLWVMHLHYQSNPRHVLSLPIGRAANSTYRIANPVPRPFPNPIDDDPA